MDKPAVCAVLLALALGASLGVASAQNEVKPAPPAAASPPPAGTQHPGTGASGAASGANLQQRVLVNGSLAVQGAPAETETTPSKFSARNAASDRLAIVAFRLKYLTDDQRHQIYQQLAGKNGALALSPAEHEDAISTVGAQLPATVALNDLAPLPEAVVEKHPELTGTGFVKSGANVLIVNMNNSEVVGVLSPQ